MIRDKTKEQAYDEVQKQLNLCTVDKAVHSAAVIIVDNEKETVKVYGLNMDESELPMLLIEAAANISDTISTLIKNRTIQWSQLILKHTNQNKASSPLHKDVQATTSNHTYQHHTHSLSDCLSTAVSQACGHQANQQRANNES